MTRALLISSALAIASLGALPAPAWASQAVPPVSSAAPAKPAIQYVGSVSIQPSQDAKVLADWYARLGIATQGYGDGGYYGMLQTAAGPFFFGIHARDPKAPAKSSGSVAVVFRVNDYDAFVAEAAKNQLTPKSVESDSTGRFAHFQDPDGNDMTIWGQ